MKKYILALLLVSLPVTAAQILQPGESITETYYCEYGEQCPEPEDLTIFQKKHGYQHPHRADDLKEDCTTCHSMYGDDGLYTTRDISCASVDEFVPPSGVDILDTSDAGVQFSTTNTKVGFLPKGTKIKCGSCHEEVDVYVNGQKREFDFEDWREDILDSMDGGTNPPPTEPPTGPVYQCDSKEMQEKHDFTPTPDTNCAACHNDGRTCQ